MVKLRFLAVCWLLVLGGSAQAACRQALALGLDVSGSVDEAEYHMQRQGLAAALTSPRVTEVLLRNSHAPVELAVYEWSGPNHQVIIQPWIVIDAANLQKTANTLHTVPRVAGDPTTAIGSAILFGTALLTQRRHCWQHTLDLSGDGPANTGPRPQDIAPLAQQPSITINGLVIGAGDSLSRDAHVEQLKALSAYYSAYVLRGPEAFVETATGFDDYAAAMERKLLRELQTVALSQMQH